MLNKIGQGNSSPWIRVLQWRGFYLELSPEEVRVYRGINCNFALRWWVITCWSIALLPGTESCWWCPRRPCLGRRRGPGYRPGPPRSRCSGQSGSTGCEILQIGIFLRYFYQLFVFVKHMTQYVILLFMSQKCISFIWSLTNDDRHEPDIEQNHSISDK